jgi:hypothetical protein
MNAYSDLNQNEILVLKAIVIASDKSTGGEFTYFDEVMCEITELTQQQVKGYISQLCQKKYIYVSDDEFCQICGSVKVDYLTDYTF